MAGPSCRPRTCDVCGERFTPSRINDHIDACPPPEQPVYDFGFLSLPVDVQDEPKRLEETRRG